VGLFRTGLEIFQHKFLFYLIKTTTKQNIAIKFYLMWLFQFVVAFAAVEAVVADVLPLV